MLETTNGEILQIPESQQILRDILTKERITSIDTLREAELAYNVAYFGSSSDQEPYNQTEIIDRENRRSRVYRISQVMNWLYPNHPPRNLLETFSAGDVSAALALPQTEITSLDSDPDIFLNVPNNTIPAEVFERLGKKKTVLGYGKDNWLRSKKRKLAFVEKLIPNWHKKIGDAYHLPFPNNMYDAVLIQDKSYVFDTIPEAARVLNPGGHIVIMLMEDAREGNYISAYQSRKPNDPIDSHPFFKDDQLKESGLERVEIPAPFKEWEELARWRSSSPSEGIQTKMDYSSGYLLEVFRKVA